MLALQNVPEMLWYIFLAVIGFWFGTKTIEKAPRRVQGLSAEDVKRVYDLEAERSYQEEMANTSRPLTNAVIMEWNRRRGHREFQGRSRRGRGCTFPSSSASMSANVPLECGERKVFVIMNFQNQTITRSAE